ncbi:MAG: hypothetical protein LUF80_06665 [Oscillospiraceae bacterium]|nr:hypothetical protein [Oscillospiraceae bacterium]
MKHAIYTIILTIICTMLTSCSNTFLPESRDITNVQLMRTLALDPGEEAQVAVTAAGDVQPGDEGGEAQPPTILTWEAPTVFSACLTIQTYGDGCVSYGHVSQCLINADLPERVGGYLLDFIERDFEMRMDIDLYAVTEGRAADLLTETASGSQSATQRLESVARDLSLTSQGWTVTLRDFLIDLADNGCALLPVAALQEEEGETTIVSDHMCWFREERLGGELTGEQSRAAAILLGQAKSGAVEVTLSDGSLVGLRLTDAEARWQPQWEGDTLMGVTAQVSVTADLAELRGDADPYEPSVQEELNRCLAQTLEEQLQDLLDLSQTETADFLHLGRRLGVQCPARSDVLQEHWDEWFPQLTLTAQVEATVERSYDVNRAEVSA